MKTVIVVTLALLWSGFVEASTALTYSGRLVNANGSPVSGPVNLRFEVFYLPNTSLIICSKTLNGISLSQGVFHTKLNFSASDCGGTSFKEVLTNVAPTDSVAIRVTDLTPTIPKVYGFQTLDAMPYSFVAEFAKSIGAMGATTVGQVLRWNGTQWAPDTIDEVAAGSIGSPELADNSVTSAKIVDLTITGADIANGTIDESKLTLADGSIPQSKVAGLAASLTAKENALSVTTSDNYLDGTKAWRNFEASVRSAFLTGFSSGPALPVVPGDSVLTALGKLDASIASVQAGSGSYVTRNGSVSMTGDLNLGNNKITNLADPTSATDGATKSYVDSKATQWTMVGSDVYYTPGGVGVGVGVLEPSAIFQVTSDSKGVLIARMTETQRNAITAPANGLMVYNTSANAINYYNGSAWQSLGVAGAGAPPSGAAGGDLEGSYPNPTLKSGIAQSKVTNLITDLAAKLDDSQLDTTATLGTDNTKIPSQAAVKAYVDSAISAGTVGGDLSGSVANATVIRLRNQPVSATAPTANQVLKWNGSAWAPAPDDDTIYTLPNVGTAGTYGSATVVPVITTDAQGRVTGVVNTPITGAAPTGTAGGDLEGSYPNPTLKTGIPQAKIANLTTDLAAKLDDSQLDTTATLGTDNTKIPSQAAVKTYVDATVSGANIGAKPVGGDLSGTVSSATVIRLQGRDVVSTLPSTNQVLKWNGTAWAPAADSDTVLTLPNVGTAGTYGSGAMIPVLTTDAQGRVTGVVNTPITGAAPTGTAGGDLSGSYPNPTISALDATKVATGAVDNTEFNYLDGVTSSIQAQLGARLPIAGGTLTGPLILAANPSVALGAATKQYVDSAILSATPADNSVTSAKIVDGTIVNADVAAGAAIAQSKVANLTTDLAGKQPLDANLTALANGDIPGALGFTPINKAGDLISSGEFNFTTSAIVRVLSPVGLTDAANKDYVDTQVATAANQWTQSAGNVYRASGNVGIGNTSPAAKLDVTGSVMLSGASNYVNFNSTQGVAGYGLRDNAGVMQFKNSGGSWTNFSSAAGGADWGFKEGPTSWISAYRNQWNNGGGSGGSIDCTSSNQGCTIGANGIYEVTCGQRSNGSGSAYLAISLNGDRAALENNASSLWTHDHSTTQYQKTRATFLGPLSAGNFITCGAPETALSSFFVYDPNGYTGYISIRRIDAAVAGTSQWNTAGSTINYTGGNVGIGTTTPAARLDVAGEVKFGNSASPCNATNEGQQRYNSVIKNMEFCNGSAWTVMGTGSSLGVGQTWQNVKASRTWNTNYTNSTGKPIMVQIGVVNTTGGDTTSCSASVNGVMVVYSGEQSNRRSTFSFIVPDGASYTVSYATNGGPVSIEFWSELR